MTGRTSTARGLSRWRGLAAAVLLVAGPVLVVTQGAASAVQGTVAGQTSSFGQTNAPVWSMAYANGAVYAVGDFTSVRPSGAPVGTSETPRQFMAAWSSADGSLLPFSHTFAAGTTATRPSVVTASPDGSRIYVGGNFTSVDGLVRNRIAAFNTADGSLVSATATDPGSFPVNVNSKVASLAVSPNGQTIYIGHVGYANGKVNNQVRLGLAAVSSSGALLPWASSSVINNVPYALAVAKDGSRVLLGGAFSGITQGGTAVANTWSAAALDPVTGAVQPDFAGGAHAAIPAPTSSCTSAVKDIVVDSSKAYFADEGTGSGCFDGTFAANLSDGSQAWKNGCLGATQAIEVVGGFLYKGSHAHDCQLTNPNGDPDNYPQVTTPGGRHLLSQRLDNGYLGAWYPDTDGGTGSGALGPRAMATDGSNLWVGGQFTQVNGQPQQGIALFAQGDARPYPPSVAATSTVPGQVKVSVLSPLDLDDTDLTITLYRNAGGTATLLQSWQVHSLFWKQPVLNFVDTAPGSNPVYTATATENNPPLATGPTGVSATVGVATSLPTMVRTVQADHPSLYWRLDDAVKSGSQPNLASDWSATTAGQAGRYYAANGRISGATADGDAATTFAGTQDQYGQGSGVYTGNVVPASGTTSAYSLEAWFQTNTTRGGKIVGFGNRPTALSTNYERMVYMDNTGHLYFGVYSGSRQTVHSVNAYNNNAWHHMVATQGPGGMVLYVDGVKVASNTVTGHQSFDGYWRVGGDQLSTWPSLPASNYFAGAIDEVAVYPAALSQTQVSNHWNARTKP